MSRRYPIEDRERGEWFQREQDDLNASAALQEEAWWASLLEALGLVAVLGIVLWLVA